MHLQWNCFHIFTNKRGTYGIIADGLRFATQLSNVYGNAIRAKLAAAQTMRSVADLFSSFVTQNLQSICSLYHRHPRFFHKSSESDSIANVGIPAIRHAPMPKAVFLFSSIPNQYFTFCQISSLESEKFSAMILAISMK